MRNSKPSKSNKSINCKYPMDVFDNICEALVDFGEMLDIDMDEPHTSISSEAQSAVIQAFYCDPECLRGTLLYHRFFRPEEVEKAKAVTLPLANELYMAAKKIDAARANSNLLQIERSFQCLSDKSHLA